MAVVGYSRVQGGPAHRPDPVQWGVCVPRLGRHHGVADGGSSSRLDPRLVAHPMGRGRRIQGTTPLYTVSSPLHTTQHAAQIIQDHMGCKEFIDPI